MHIWLIYFSKRDFYVSSHSNQYRLSSGIKVLYMSLGISFSAPLSLHTESHNLRTKETDVNWMLMRMKKNKMTQSLKYYRSKNQAILQADCQTWTNPHLKRDSQSLPFLDAYLHPHLHQNDATYNSGDITN